MRLGWISRGERLVIRRRREGLTQAQVARAEFGVSVYRYQRWERDEDDPPFLSIGKLAEHERCFLLRRRAGLTAREIADSIGVCEWWVNRMELGSAPCDRLIEHWLSAVA